PKNVTDAMILQMSAERSRRAVVIEADGRKTATVTVAEGDKQSAILRAEGGRQAAILGAEGYAQALSTIFGAAKGIDEKTLMLQYLDALKTLGASQIGRAHVLNSSHEWISYAVFCLKKKSGLGNDALTSRMRTFLPNTTCSFQNNFVL